MKLKNKLISLLSVLLIAPAFLLACTSGGGSGGGGDDPGPGPEPIPPEILEPLKFTATKNSSTISYVLSESLFSKVNIQYSTDDGESWIDWTHTASGGKIINLNNGDSICVRNTSETLSEEAWQDYFYFSMGSSGAIEASGNINSMINYGALTPHCFNCMFCWCTSLTKAAIMFPTNKLETCCYEYMFQGCTALTSGPTTLPATTLAEHCYDSMFNGCIALESTPNLPATKLADYCYHCMFQTCKGLNSTPELPADDLAEACYRSMFKDCINLTSAKRLKATKLAVRCYDSMFEGCKNLFTAPTISATKLANYCCYYMFYNCTGLRIPPNLPDTQLESYCYISMFNGCESLKVKDESGGSGGFKFFTCPTIEAGVQNPVKNMFYGTAGDFTGETPTEGDSYYWYT